MAKVSKYVLINDSEGIKSAYFDIDPGYTPNLGLKVNCSAFLVYLATFDIKRDVESNKELYQAFNRILEECAAPEDYEYVDGFFAQTSIVGEVGKAFYQTVKDRIAKNNTIFRETDKPVSSMTEENGQIVGIESKYFENDYRPQNLALHEDCSKLLTAMAIHDIKRDADSFSILLGTFNTLLTKCESELDFNEVRTFLANTAQIGFVSERFYNSVKNQLSKDAKMHIIRSKVDREERNDQVGNFNLEYEKCMEVFTSLDFDNLTMETLEGLKAELQSLNQQLKSVEAFLTEDEHNFYRQNLDELTENLTALIESTAKLIA